MPASLGEAVLYLLGDDSKLKAHVDQAEKDTQASLTKIGRGLQIAGGALTLGITTPLVAMGIASIDAASDLEESMNAVNVVFEDAADAILLYGETAAQTVGLSKTEFNELATVTGAFLQNVGFDMNEAGLETITLTERASDMASVFNTDVADAMNAILSGLKGEMNPLERFGVKLSAVTVEAKALSMGLGQSNVDLIAMEEALLKVESATGDVVSATAEFGEGSLEAREALLKLTKAEAGLEETMAGGNVVLDDTMKAQATLALIYQQTDKTAGDFLNTSDGLANSQRIMTKELANASAELGQMLLPIALQVTNAIRDLVGWFTALTPEGQKTALIVAVVAAAIGPLLVVVGTLITAFAAIMPVLAAVGAVLTGPIILTIGLVIAAIALLYFAWTNNWGGIQEKTTAAVDYIKVLINGFLNLVKAWWSVHGAEILKLLTGMWENLKILWNGALEFIKEITSAFIALLSGDFDGFKEHVSNAWQTLWDTVETLVDNSFGVLEGYTEGFFGVMALLFAGFKSAFEGDWEAFGENLRAAWDLAWEEIKETLSNAWTNLKDTAADLVTDIMDFFKETDWASVGTSIIDGIRDGISAASQGLIDAAVAVASAAIAAVKGFLRMESPSRLTMDMGEDFTHGFAGGIDNNAGSVVKAALRMAKAAVGVLPNVTNHTYSLNAQFPPASGQSLTEYVNSLRLMEATR